MSNFWTSVFGSSLTQTYYQQIAADRQGRHSQQSAFRADNQKLVSQVLNDKPHLTREYVTGVIDAIENTNQGASMKAIDIDELAKKVDLLERFMVVLMQTPIFYGMKRLRPLIKELDDEISGPILEAIRESQERWDR